jgi:hypothetical protein
LQLAYTYEQQGFHLDNGLKYLPDFFLSCRQSEIQMRRRVRRNPLLTNVARLLAEHAWLVERIAAVRAELERLESLEARKAARPAPRPVRRRRPQRPAASPDELAAIRERALAHVARLKSVGEAQRRTYETSARAEPNRQPSARTVPSDAAAAAAALFDRLTAPRDAG